MSMHDQLIMTITGHEEIVVTANRMDQAINRYLPGSCYSLRQKVDAHPKNQYKPGHYDNLITVTEYLMVLARLDGQG